MPVIAVSLILRLHNTTCYDLEVDARLGFIQSDGMITQTWVLLSTNGTLIFNSGETSSTEVDKAYNQTEVEWIHLAISCDSPSGRCHIFRNCSLIGELFGREWFVSSQLYVGKFSTANAHPICYSVTRLQLLYLSVQVSLVFYYTFISLLFQGYISASSSH